MAAATQRGEKKDWNAEVGNAGMLCAVVPYTTRAVRAGKVGRFIVSKALEPGTRIADRYDVIREIGRGGMGVVYLCTDLVRNDRAALKLLHTMDDKPEPGSVAWFWAEARALTYLDHPGIVRARDFGVLANGAPYLAMDVAQGMSLTDLLSVTDLTWPAIWLIVDKTLAALAHAHARGVIHGDLKHSNIMVKLEPHDVKVSILDFGLAWLLRDRFDHRIDGTAREGPMVRPHAGTVGWMAPEQIRGAIPHVGPPTDLYALGCVLFHLLTGSEPYESEDLQEMQRMHRNAPVPHVTLPEGVPSGVASFVTRLLAKRPWHRYAFAAEARKVFSVFRPSGPIETWDLPPVPEEEATTLRPPSRNISATYELPVHASTPPGLLAFGPSSHVGRNELKNQLREQLRLVTEAEEPTTRMVLLTGEAGVGKSHLAEWLCEDAHERAVAIPLRARHHKIPSPVDGLVGAVLSHFGLENAERDVVERALMNVWEVSKNDRMGLLWVAAAAEWLHPSPPNDRGEPGPSGIRFVINNEGMRWRIIHGVLERIGRTMPLLIWLDDLHLATERDLGFLEYLLDHPVKTRVMLLATMPTGGLGAPAEKMSPILSLRGQLPGKTLTVEPLPEHEMRQMLLNSAQLDENVLDALVSRANGFPLFALQMLFAWIESGAVKLKEGVYHLAPDATIGVPSTTAALWEERLSTLPNRVLDAAMATSALGGELRMDVIVPLLKSLDISAEDSLWILQQSQLIQELHRGRYRWAHRLLQEHLLQRLQERPEAAKVFREAAHVLGSYHPAAGTRRIVRHRVTNLIRAGEENEAVRVMLDFVAKDWSRSRDVKETLRDLAQVEHLVRGRWAAIHQRWKAEALRHAGRLEEARKLASEAHARLSRLGDVPEIAQCLRLIGHIDSDRGQPRDGRRLVQEAAEILAREHDEHGRAQCEVVIAEIDYLLGEYEEAERMLLRGLPVLSREEDVLVHGQSLILLALIYMADGRCHQAEEHLQKAREGFEQIGYRLGVAQCDVALAHVDHRKGELQASLARAHNALLAFELLGTPRGISAALRVMAMASLDSSDLEHAREYATKTLEVFEQLGDPWGLVESKLLLAQIALARRDTSARDILAQCEIERVQEKEPLQHWHLTQAWLACLEKRFEDALDHLREAHNVLGPGRLADHSLQLFARVSAMPWPEALRERVEALVVHSACRTESTN